MLNDHREGRHGDKNRLENLLEAFRNAQCLEPRDKIYGFLGLANDSPDDQMEIDYSKPLFEIYEEVIRFQHSTSSLEDGGVYAQVDRQLRLVRFSRIVQDLFNGAIKEQFHLGKRQIDFEIPPLWARGVIAGKILDIGPTLSETIGSFAAFKKWKSSFVKHYKSARDLTILKEVDEEYSKLLLSMDEERLARVYGVQSVKSWGESDGENSWNTNRPSTPLPGRGIFEAESPETTGGPRRFLADRFLMGLVPPQARVDDVICRFWKSDIAIIMRPQAYSARYMLVGRADVMMRTDVSAHQMDTQSMLPADEYIASVEHGGVMNICFDIDALQQLTW